MTKGDKGTCSFGKDEQMSNNVVMYRFEKRGRDL